MALPVVGHEQPLEVRVAVEAELVPGVLARLPDPPRLDRHGRHLGAVAVRDVPRHAMLLRHVATPTRSYAGGTPARCASCRRMIPSIRASGRGGQNGM